MSNSPADSAPTPRPSDPSGYAELVYAVLSAAAEVERTHTTEVHQLGPESMLMLSIGDGLMEALEWAHDGVTSDEPACMWLGALRWIRAVDRELPDGAPVPPARPFTDHMLALGVQEGGDPQNIVGLRSPEMSLPHRPFNRPAASVPELAATDGPGVLARAIALGVVPYLPIEQTRSFATAAAALSHGSPQAHAACADAAELIVRATHQMPQDAGENSFIQALERAAEVGEHTQQPDRSAQQLDHHAQRPDHNNDGVARSNLTLAAGVALNALGTDASEAHATDVGTALADEGYLQAGVFAAALIAAVTGKSGTRHHYPLIEEYSKKLAELMF